MSTPLLPHTTIKNPSPQPYGDDFKIPSHLQTNRLSILQYFLFTFIAFILGFLVGTTLFFFPSITKHFDAVTIILIAIATILTYFVWSLFIDVWHKITGVEVDPTLWWLKIDLASEKDYWVIDIDCPPLY
jgi:hypothetical protein